jgi:RNA polymerase sigma-70 factor (ECF subfamily)
MTISGAVLDLDTQLMLNVREGDSESFELLLHRHRTAVLNHLFRMVHNRGIAEELAQDVFIRVYRSRQRYEPQAKFKTWLFHIATNVALNWYRDTRRQMAELHTEQLSHNTRAFELPDHRLRVDEVLLRQHRADEIRAAVQSLPSKQLAAVLLHKFEGMEYTQIAEVLNCSIPALKSLLFRAYGNLRRQLAHLNTVGAGNSGESSLSVKH